MSKKVIGSILMIIGTAVGAGMLALPVATAHANFQTTLIMMLFSWSIMTIGALALLEVNLWFPAGSNLISMVGNTFGSAGKIITWIAYLLLLYSLLCAYLAGTSDILKGLLNSVDMDLSHEVATLLALVLLGAVVIRGVSTVDVVNRGLMSIKLLAYLILVLAIMPHISFSHLTEGRYVYSTSTLMVIVTSFGFANIVPTLRGYLNSDVIRLKQVIIWGSFSALVIYFFWTGSVQGLFSREGAMGLISVSQSQAPNSLLMKSMSALVNNVILSDFAKLFISICAVTSFLGVALSLTDFIADGFQYKKQGLEGIKVYMLTFLPPFLIVLFAPGIFIKALSYAGFCCIFLLILLPIIMLYRGRYIKSFTGSKIVPGGKTVLILTAIISVMLLIFELVEVGIHI
jgi:tyrosine-specific transport protein